jgi:hypothetical protein
VAIAVAEALTLVSSGEDGEGSEKGLGWLVDRKMSGRDDNSVISSQSLMLTAFLRWEKTILAASYRMVLKWKARKSY